VKFRARETRALKAMFSGIPVMAKWVNGRMLWAFSKLLKS